MLFGFYKSLRSNITVHYCSCQILNFDSSHLHTSNIQPDHLPFIDVLIIIKLSEKKKTVNNQFSPISDPGAVSSILGSQYEKLKRKSGEYHNHKPHSTTNTKRKGVP